MNKGSNFANFVRLRPHTYARTQQSLPPLWVAINTYPNILAIFQTKLAPCNGTIISGVVSDVFLGKILIIVPAVYYQMPYLKMSAMVLMKQMLILLRKPYLPKVREIKESEDVGVISKLES